MSDRRVLIFGLDGGTLELVKRWAGQLPNLNHLIETGVSGDLLSTIPPITAAAWNSFMTGQNPGKHGVFDFIQKQQGTYETALINSTYRKGTTIWKLANQQGRKVGVFNVPGTYPPEIVDGFMVTGFLTPDVESDFTYPRELADRLRESDYEILTKIRPSKKSEEIFLKAVYRGLDKREKTVLHLLESQDWDLFIAVFTEADLVSHFFWKYMDETHPSYDRTKAATYGKTILAVYQRLDAIIGKMLESLNEKDVVVVGSDHGFGPLHEELFINNYLLQLGLLVLKESAQTHLKHFLHRQGLTLENIYKLATMLGISNLLQGDVGFNASSKSLRKRLLNLFLSFSDVDWTKTKAYAVGNYGQIFINLKGREPTGIVTPGTELDELKRYITAKLYELNHPLTNEPIVETVYDRDEIYWGPATAIAPDIVYLTKGMRYMSSRFFEFGSNQVVGDAARERSGGHTLTGMIVIHGDGLKTGFHLSNAQIIDVAPTVLHILDIPVPKAIDGRILTEAFSEESDLARRAPNYIDETRDIGLTDSTALEESDNEKVRKRLQDLGYIG